jgi:DNA-binding beta-propeller fold protein YncE
VIDGATNQVIATLADPNATNPYAVGVDPIAHRVYIVNGNSANVTVIAETP